MPSRTTWSPRSRSASKLLKYNDPRNLVGFALLTHTRFTYHRTWETGLGAEIRVTVANPAFFCVPESAIGPPAPEQPLSHSLNPLESTTTDFQESSIGKLRRNEETSALVGC